MTEEKKKNPAKAVAPKAAAPKAAAPKKAVPAPKAEAKKPAQKQAPTGKTLTIVQIGSPIGRRFDQEATLVGLGLNKMRRQSTLEDTPSVRGMINKIKHLVKVVG